MGRQWSDGTRSVDTDKATEILPMSIPVELKTI